MEGKEQKADTKQTPRIALTFSGGGYRAAGFSLGVLSFLEQVQMDGGKLLDCILVLSTVSGGTIAGTRYALGLKASESMQAIYKSLYDFMSKKDLVALALDRLIEEKHWKDGRSKSLINAVADVYDKHLFKGTKFGAILNEDKPIHLKHISFNATEFGNALQFRFQTSEKLLTPGAGEPQRGIIGNHYYRLSPETAREVRMADVLACSSCFPGGFEPLLFPDDFVLKEKAVVEILQNSLYPVALMDGGIVDNQGIAPVLLADVRMKKNLLSDTEGEVGNALDLIIVSDVASPYMKPYEPYRRQKISWWQRFTPQGILLTNSCLLIASVSGLVWSLSKGAAVWSAVSSGLFVLSFLLFLLGRYLKVLPRRFEVPDHFLHPLSKLLRLRLQQYDAMILTRARSLLKMTGEVFLKHIRRLNYNTIFSDKAWANRRIMNGIYELRAGEEQIGKKVAVGTLPEYLLPSPAVQQVAGLASSVGTTLWFTPEELAPDQNGYNTLDALIACGQFTICWNLLEYIEKLKKGGDNMTPRHRLILSQEDELRRLWEKFQEGPFWLVKIYNEQKVGG